jgi:hypothetical protein
LAFLAQVPLWALGWTFIVIERRKTRVLLGMDPPRRPRPVIVARRWRRQPQTVPSPEVRDSVCVIRSPTPGSTVRVTCCVERRRSMRTSR